MEEINSNKLDEVLRFLFDNHGVRGEIVSLNKACADLIHEDYASCIKSTMMELAAAAILFAATLKDGSEVMLQLQGGKNAPLKYALVNVRDDLSFYGSAKIKENSNIDEHSSFKALVGDDGILALSVFPVSGEKWQGIVAIDSESVCATLENYFKNSQQLPSKFFIHSDPQSLKCSGLMLQIIPEIKNNVESLEHLSILSSTLTTNESLKLNNKEILSRLFAHEEIRIFPEHQVAFKCICSKDRCLNSLMSLRHDELKEIASDPKGIDMTCQHCGNSYHFSHDELQKLFLQVNQ